MAKRGEHLLYDKSISRISDLYHHPDGFYTLEALLNLIQTYTGFGVERVHTEEVNNSEGKIYLIASGAQYRCVVRDED